MPRLERRALTLAAADLAEDGYGPFGVNDSGQIVYLVSRAGSPIFRVVDSTGKRLRAFGWIGDGPGEFRNPLELQVRSDSLHIFDEGRMTRLAYRWDGRALGETRALVLDIPLAWIGDSLDHWVPPGMTRTERSVLRRTQVGGSAGRVLIAEEDSGFKAVLSSTPGGKRLMRLPYALGPNRIYLGDPYQYRIYSYDAAGHFLARFGRDLPPLFRGPEEIARFRRRILASGPPSTATRSWLDTLGREIRPHFTPWGFEADMTGRLWVIGMSNDSTAIDVFSDTTFLGRVSVPCFLLQGTSRIALAPGWLLLECELPQEAELSSELQLYRIVEPKRTPGGT